MHLHNIFLFSFDDLLALNVCTYIFFLLFLSYFTMVPKLQLCLTKFFFDARVQGSGEGSQGMGPDILLLLVERKPPSMVDVIETWIKLGSYSVSNCNAPPSIPTQSFGSNCILLNAICTSAPIFIPQVEFSPFQSI